MNLNFLSLTLSLFCFQQVFASPMDAVRLANLTLEKITSKNFDQPIITPSCAPTIAYSSFQNKSDLINFLCNKSQMLQDEDLKNELLKKNAGDFIELHKVDDLIKSLKSFQKVNNSIPDMFNQSTDKDWKLGDQNMSQYPCEYKVKENSQQNFQQMNFKNVAFLGSSHFSKKSEEELPQAKKDLSLKLSTTKPDALLIEGKDYGQPIDCGAVLTDALSVDSDIKSEMRETIKYGFWNQIPLIPADNQKIDDTDLSFFNGDEVAMKNAKKSFEFMDILHNYHDTLKKNNSMPIDALTNLFKNSKTLMKLDEFLNLYQELNQRTLPTDPKEIMKDFSPSIVTDTPRGSNKLADFQNEIRNKSLVKAIQISSSNYQSPTVIYGSGHLGQIGQTLETYLGKPKNIDFDSACK